MRPSIDELPRTTINGASLAIHESGQGEPVVLVHGGVSDIRTWDGLAPALSQTHRIVRYSRRYARPNEDIPDGLDDRMEPHVDDLIALIESLGTKPAHLVGHSWGAFICLLAAIRDPGAVRSLVLMEPPVLSLFVHTPPRPIELLRVLWSRPKTGRAIVAFGVGAVAPAQRAFRRGDTDAAIEAFGRGVLGDHAYDQLSDERRQQVRANVKTDRAQLMGAGFPPLSDDDVRRVQAPTLLVHGERSPALFPCLLDRLEELLPHAERYEVPNASHIMYEDNPEAVSLALLSFLGRSASGIKT